MSLIAIFLGLLFLYSLASARLAKTPVTAPILFTAAGMLAFLCFPQIPTHRSGLEVFLHAAEVGLVMLLFTDASRTDLVALRGIVSLPARLLGIGMPLTILLGGVAAKLVFPGFSIWEAGILAAILAPTDAGLGQVIVDSPLVPARIRQALNVEAGLNDGLSVPFLLFFLAMSGAPGEEHHARFISFVIEQLGYGAAIGVGIGLIGGVLIAAAERRKLIAEALVPIATASLPLLCIVASEATGASMFIAAFVAGMAVQVRFKDAGKHAVEFTEGWGQFLNLSVFFLFGILFARAWKDIEAACYLYAAISLTLVRIVPVAISLIGARLGWATIVFMGWFGPRGLASIVLGLVYLEHVNTTLSHSEVGQTIMATVALSIFAHGFSALPGINWYAAGQPGKPGAREGA